MKLNKALRGYYREQVDAVTVAGAIPVVKRNGRGAGSPVFAFAFHTVLIGLIVMATISGYNQPSHLEQRMAAIIDRYNIEARLTDSLESLIIIIKKNRDDGGAL
ncbi:MAG: hypothetical protein KA369_17160 [Spirochaetes bacterium]|nr:hypothetical protein [Spirochaetota bacterium]